MLTLNDAQRVRKAVLDRYEGYLPAGLAPKVRAKPIAEIFFILPEAEYTRHFDAYYRSFFAAINVVALGKKTKTGEPKKGTASLIGIARDPDNVYDSFACPAFCAPAVNPTDRKIYVNVDAGSTIGTLYHEFIHYLSHANFYPEMYAMGGKSPIILEGVTEYLTREVNPIVKNDRASQGKYQPWYAEVGATISGVTATDRMARMAFRGELADVATLGGTIPSGL